MKLTLGVNLGFAINRYIEPEVWTRAVSEGMGLSHVQFVADLLNPCWPESYIESQLKRLERSMKETGVQVDSIFTSTMTRSNLHAHPDEEARLFWHEWYKKMLAYGARLGATMGGGHFGSMTFDTYEDESKRKFATDEAIRLWSKLCDYAADIGYTALLIEPMSVGREFATTVAETKRLMDAVSAKAKIPMLVNQDVGHAPDPNERDPYPWLEALAPVSPIVHLQQTVLHKSLHQPFTPECNKDGIIEAQKVIDALERGGCKETMLIFEISHREHADTDSRIIADHRASVEYWQPFVDAHNAKSKGK